MNTTPFQNPFRPGAGHMPPHLAGRQEELGEFEQLLQQPVVLENMVLTGLRGTGKTVLLDTFKPLAIAEGWQWVGTDLSESVSISEERLAIRLITDLAVVTSSIVVSTQETTGLGFAPKKRTVKQYLDFDTMFRVYHATPGLVIDKLKRILEIVWHSLQDGGARGIIFAYDEAQNLADHAEEKEYPLSLLLDLFQSIQKQGIPFMLVLAGLPTLFSKLVEARTFAERMFHVVFLDRLDTEDSRDAIVTPLIKSKCPEDMMLSTTSQETIIQESGGYPYFIQFICREVYDVFVQQFRAGKRRLDAPVDQITRKLDTDFFAGRWSRATDRQRDLLIVVAHLESSDGEFSIQEVADMSETLTNVKTIPKPFSASHVSQMFGKLTDVGLIYKNRHAKYSFAVPLLGRYIRRQLES